MRRIASACLVCMVTAPLAQAAVDAGGFSEQALGTAARLRDEALDGTHAWDIVSSLTTEVGPRSAGSAGDRAAVAWALRTLRDSGFANVRAENVEVPHWERGAIEARITEPFPQPLVATALGGSVGTPEEGLEAPVLQVADIAELESVNRSLVAGKIVFFNKHMRRSRDGAAYSVVVKARTDGAVAAARLGAVGVAIRSVGTSIARVAHTGTVKYQTAIEQIPAIALSNADADMLQAQLETGQRVDMHIKLTARQLPPARSANVIAEVPGTAANADIVLLAAHLDSWDLGTGAIDDGAGVAIVVEAARRIADAHLQLDRTLRILLAANEEFGLSGAKAYAASRSAERVARHAVGLEADFGAGRIWRLESRVAMDALPLVQAMQAVLSPLGIELGGNAADGGADLSPLRQLGMPVLGLTNDGSRYFDFHHTASDTLDKISRGSLDQCVAAYAAAAYLAAVAPGGFGRLEPEPPEDGDAVPAGEPPTPGTKGS